MNELLKTARAIQEIIDRGHPARQVFTHSLSFRAIGDRVGKSTRQIEIAPLKFDSGTMRLEEIGYMAGGIGSPQLKPVILPVGAEEVKLKHEVIIDQVTGKPIKVESVIGLPRGTWMAIYIDVQERLGKTHLERQKGKYRNWLETGRQPIYDEDPTVNIVGAMIQAEWKPLDPKKEKVLSQGLVALLTCLQEQPKNYILELPLRSKGAVG